MNASPRDQLVVALEHVGRRGQRVVAEVAGPRGAVGPGGRCRHAAVGKGGVLGPAAAVEHAHDHALAGVGGPAELVVQGGGADEPGAGVGDELAQVVLLHRGHAGEAQQVGHLVAGDLEGDPAIDGAQGVPGLGGGQLGPQGAQELALDPLDIAGVATHGGVPGVEPLAGDRRTGGGEALDAAAVAGQRVVVELDDHVDRRAGGDSEQALVGPGQLAGGRLGPLDPGAAQWADGELPVSSAAGSSRRRGDRRQHQHDRAHEGGETEQPPPARAAERGR